MTHYPTHQEAHEDDCRAARCYRHEPFPEDPIHALEEALRIARAATHEKRLDTATQAALAATVQFGHAVVDAMRHHERKIEALKDMRPIIDP